MPSKFRAPSNFKMLPYSLEYCNAKTTEKVMKNMLMTFLTKINSCLSNFPSTGVSELFTDLRAEFYYKAAYNERRKQSDVIELF